MKRFLKLYKMVDGEKRLVDYGARDQAWKYHKQGYMLEWSRYHSPVYKVLKAEFDELWSYLSDDEKARLHDLAYDKELGMEERLQLLHAELSYMNDFDEYLVDEVIEEIEPLPSPKLPRRSLFSFVADKVTEFVESVLVEPMFAFGHF